MGLTVLDIILLIPLLYGFIKGLSRGLVGELASIVSLLGGLLLAFYFSEHVYVYLRDYLSNPGIETRVIAFIVVFIVVVVVINLVSRGVTKMLNAIALGAVNHLLGGIFGVLKWMFITTVAVYFFDNLQKDSHFVQNQTLEESIIYGRLSGFAENYAQYIDQASGMSYEYEPNDDEETKPSSP